MQRLRNYFFQSTSDQSRLLTNDKPRESVFRDFLDSIPFFREITSSRASTTDHGLVKKASQTQFDAGTDQDPQGRELYPQPSQIQGLLDGVEDSILGKMSRVLHFNPGNAASSAVSETSVDTYQMPGGTMVNDNFDTLEIEATFTSGSFGLPPSTNSRTVSIKFGTAYLGSFDMGVGTSGEVDFVRFVIRATRLNATTLHLVTEIQDAVGGIITVRDTTLHSENEGLTVTSMNSLIPIDITANVESPSSEEVRLEFWRICVMKQ
jgi:hypothetical protein